MPHRIRLTATASERLHVPAKVAVAHLALSSRIKALLAFSACGAVLLLVAVGLDVADIEVSTNGLRWLYFMGTNAFVMVLWAGIVEMVSTQLELFFFLQLTMLPESRGLYTTWLAVLGCYISFMELFTVCTVNGDPPGALGSVEDWLRRILLCMLIFTSVSVVVTAVSNYIIAALYSSRNQHKMVTALQHEYIMLRLVGHSRGNKRRRRFSLLGGSSAAPHAAGAPSAAEGGVGVLVSEPSAMKGPYNISANGACTGGGVLTPDRDSHTPAHAAAAAAAIAGRTSPSLGMSLSPSTDRIPSLATSSHPSAASTTGPAWSSLLADSSSLDTDQLIHIRRTLLASLELHDWLREQRETQDREATADSLHMLARSSVPHFVVPSSALKDRLEAMRRSRWRQLISPRVLLEELLHMYSNMTDHDIRARAAQYAAAVWQSAAPEGKSLSPGDLAHLFPNKDDRAVAWRILDANREGELTLSAVEAAAVSFLQQKRNLSLTVSATRMLALSLQVSIVLIINCIFLMVVYLNILEVAEHFTNGSKTSLDFFSAYVVVVSLLFAEQIKSILSGCILLLAQQPFDVGEEIIIEEAPGWRYMGIIQDFNLIYLRMKKSADGELVTLPLQKLVQGKFTNLTRSDWKVEQNYFSVDLNTPLEVLHSITEAAVEAIQANPGEFDVDYGFLAVFHGFDRPNKAVIRTFHKYKFNLSVAHKRIAKARGLVMNAVRARMAALGVSFTELRLHASMDHGAEPQALLPHAGTRRGAGGTGGALRPSAMQEAASLGHMHMA